MSGLLFEPYRGYLVVELVPDVPLLPLVPLLVPVPAPDPMPVLPEPMLPVPVVELGLVLLGLVLEPELDVPLVLSRRHWSFCVPVRRSQFCELVPDTLLEELLGDEEVELGEEVLELESVLLPVLEDVLGEEEELELLGDALEPVLLPVPRLEPALLESLVLGVVALVLPEPTLEPDEPILPLLEDCANAVAEIASSAALTAALSTLKFMIAPSKVGKSLQPLRSKRCAAAPRVPPQRPCEHGNERAAVRAAPTRKIRFLPV